MHFAADALCVYIHVYTCTASKGPLQQEGIVAFLLLAPPSFRSRTQANPDYDLSRKDAIQIELARGVNVARASEIVRKYRETSVHARVTRLLNASRYKMRHALPVFTRYVSRFAIESFPHFYVAFSAQKASRDLYTYARLSKKRKMQMRGTKDLRTVMENLDNAERESRSPAARFHVITFSVGSLFRVHM